MPEIYTIYFKDKTIFKGGESLDKSLWSNMPDKAIDYLVYSLADGSFLVLKGFEKYAHIVEATMTIHGPKGTKLGRRLENLYLMGLKNGIVTSYRINLIGERGQSKYIKGDITRRDYPLGKEFKGKPINKTCWK